MLFFFAVGPAIFAQLAGNLDVAALGKPALFDHFDMLRNEGRNGEPVGPLVLFAGFLVLPSVGLGDTDGAELGSVRGFGLGLTDEAFAGEVHVRVHRVILSVQD